MAQLEEFLNELRVNNLAEGTIRYYSAILKDVNKFKNLEKPWIKEDVDKYVLSLKGKNKENSIETKKTIIKKYFQWCSREDIVKHLQINRPKCSLKREDILDTTDVSRMIDATESPLYKALISFLFESGARIGEVLRLKFNDIQETDEGMIINISATKTGNEYRRNIFPTSTQYIRNLIMYANLSDKNKLFYVTENAANRMLKKIGKKAGIKKPVSCHKFRHAQATDMVIRGYQESIIRKKLGWTDDSRMIATYTHLVDDDVINATLEKSGM
jgi:integrase/recombinase XerD